MSKKSNLPPFENSLTEINKLIEKMEHQELSLEDSLKHFERGITLIKHCQQVLEKAEQKVKILMQANNEEILTPYLTDTEQPEIQSDGNLQ